MIWWNRTWKCRQVSQTPFPRVEDGRAGVYGMATSVAGMKLGGLPRFSHLIPGATLEESGAVPFHRWGKQHREGKAWSPMQQAWGSKMGSLMLPHWSSLSPLHASSWAPFSWFSKKTGPLIFPEPATWAGDPPAASNALPPTLLCVFPTYCTSAETKEEMLVGFSTHILFINQRFLTRECFISQENLVMSGEIWVVITEWRAFVASGE